MDFNQFSQFLTILLAMDVEEESLDEVEVDTDPIRMALAAADEWMQVFSEEEFAFMFIEIFQAALTAYRDNDLEPVRSVIHEWHESALAIANDGLREALLEPSEEIELGSPRVRPLCYHWSFGKKD